MDDTRHLEEQHQADALMREIRKQRCRAKHTEFQPRFEDQWECPECGADNEWVTIDDNDPAAHDHCDDLHCEDVIRCYLCNIEWSGEDFANHMQKKFEGKDWVPTVGDLVRLGVVRDWVSIRALHILRCWVGEEEEFDLLRVVVLREDKEMEIQYMTPGIHCQRVLDVPMDIFVGPWKLWCKQQKAEREKLRTRGRRTEISRKIDKIIEGLTEEQIEKLLNQLSDRKSLIF